MVNPDVKDKIITYLVDNHEHIRERVRSYTNDKLDYLEKYNKVFHDDIRDGYLEVVTSYLVTDLANRYAISAEDVLVVLEDLDLEQYLN